jgi:polyphenol oxidase
VPIRAEHPAPGGGTVHVATTGTADGDLAVGGDPALLAERRSRIAAHPWTWLHQVHGAGVVVVDGPGAGAGRRADAAVTAAPRAVLAVHTADCAGVALWSEEGEPVVGAAHAGWRGLDAGVLEATVAAMRRLGARSIRYVQGPTISPAAYEFGEAELAGLCSRLGPELRSVTVAGAPALDLRAGVRRALAAVGAEPTDVAAPPCTATDEGFWSHRARGDAGRQATVVWWEP